jgi:hypothetical protein
MPARGKFKDLRQPEQNGREPQDREQHISPWRHSRHHNIRARSHGPQTAITLYKSAACGYHFVQLQFIQNM